MVNNTENQPPLLRGIEALFNALGGTVEADAAIAIFNDEVGFILILVNGRPFAHVALDPEAGDTRERLVSEISRLRR